jgi:hypothetical protein
VGLRFRGTVEKTASVQDTNRSTRWCTRKNGISCPLSGRRSRRRR